MKNMIIILMLILISITDLYCQTYEPSKIQMEYKGSNVYLDEHPDFETDEFILGWHWYSGYKMSKALKMNMIHVYSEASGRYLNPNLDTIAHNAYMIVCVPHIGHHWHGFPLSNSIGMQYEPTLEVDTADPFDFSPRLGDTTRPIFGFGYIRGYIETNSNDENFNRLQLFTDSLENGVILSEPWVNNNWVNFIEVDQNNKIINDYINNVYNIPEPWDENDKLYAVDYKGVNFYISINLRRLGTDNIINNDTVLSIRMPFVNLPNESNDRITGYIRYNLLPDTDYADTTHCPHNRGIIRNLREIQGGEHDSVIYITRDMIPTTSETDRDITISAHFICDGKPYNPYRNYGLETFPGIEDSLTIDSLKIEVHYYDNADLAIDWLRIETRPSRELWQGNFDNTIIDKMQESIDSLTTSDFEDDSIKLYRWYLYDEPGFDKRVMFWQAHRYFVKMFGRVFTHEVDPQIKQYKYLLDYPEKWNGLRKAHAWRCVPYIRYAKGDLFQRFGYGYGFDMSASGDLDSIKFQKMFDCKYETQFFETSHTVETDTGVQTVNLQSFYDFEEYSVLPSEFGNLGYGTILEQDQIEYNYFYNDDKNYYLYDSTSWWGQINLDARMILDSQNQNSYIKQGGHRILTGEELFSFMSGFLIHGAKGIVIDGEATYFNEDNTFSAANLHAGQSTVNNFDLNEVDDDVFLRIDTIGADYFLVNEDEKNELFIPYFDTDIFADSLGIDRDSLGIAKFYLGRESMRREYAKIAKWIRANEDELMDLRFVAGISKGFRRLYTQDPSLATDTIIDNFISFDQYNVKTRPIGRIKANGDPYYENEGLDTQLNRIDSAFYNITLLKNIADTDMDSVFYIGVMNRRCSPHIYIGSEYTNNPDSIVFRSTSELEDLALSDTTNLKYWWGRFGSREINIPFNVPQEDTVNYDCLLLKVTELGVNNATLCTGEDGAWDDDRMYHRIDTMIIHNGYLSVKLHPGEGKILKIELLPSNTEITGNLEFSNQHKLVAYPEYDDLGNETGKLRYHLVYHKKDDNDTSYVYYARSKPTDKNSSYENIVWEDWDYKISGEAYRSPSISYDSLECYHPSLVVRKNTIGQDCAFICYSCELQGYDNIIVEDILTNINDSTFSDSDSYVLADFSGTISENWGTPVINASPSYNYYTWSDEESGIGIGAKTPVYGTLVDSLHIEIDPFDEGNEIAKHPSLNLYSNSNPEPVQCYDNFCSIVWQESVDPGIYGDILYSQLEFDGTDINYSLPNTIDTAYNFEELNATNTIGKVSTDSFNRLPFIHTELTNNPSSINRNDYVFYERRMYYSNWINIYHRRFAYQKDSIPAFTARLEPELCISSLSDNYIAIRKPNITQGKLIANYLDSIHNADLLLNMVSYYNTAPSPTPGPILEMALPFQMTSNYSITNDSYTHVIATGDYPHLAGFFCEVTPDFTWKNRRVFESDPYYGSTPSITTSAKGFYRTTSRNKLPNEYSYGFSGDSTYYLVDFPTLNDEPINFKLPRKQIDSTEGREQYIIAYTDTLISDVFTVGNNDVFGFKSIGRNNANFKLCVLDAEADTTIACVSVPQTERRKGYKNRYIMVNGRDREYKLMIVNLDTNAKYTETIFIDGLMVENVSPRQVYIDGIIDLGKTTSENTSNRIQMNLFPNPTDETLYVTAYMPVSAYTETTKERSNTLSLSIYSLLGERFYQVYIKPGETIKVDVDTYPIGTYIIRAEEVINSTVLEPVSPGTERFVIER
jgi:hypothetical protein